MDFRAYRFLLTVLVCLALPGGAFASTLTAAYASQTPGFALEFDGELCPYPLMSAFVMPGTTLEFSVVAAHPDRGFLADAEAGELVRVEAMSWRWRAPEEPGYSRITVQDFTTGRAICIKAFVLVPYDGSGSINGYAIGSYASPRDDDPVYDPPAGLLEVTPEIENTWVSPNFQLEQFVCKQESDYPKYMVLKTRLLLKLEMLVDDLVRLRGRVPAIHVMSAYRTPYYNRKIGNRTTYSRHLYGDAADIFVDEDGDESMDDVNGDGLITTGDAGTLYRQVEELFQEPWYTPFIGGMGLYGPRRDRGPFVHIDTRGSHARWGDRRGGKWLRANRLLEETEDGTTIIPPRRIEPTITSRFLELDRLIRR